MIIRNDVENMEVEKEIQHIVKSLNIIIKKLGCKTFVLNNRHTKEDIAFMEIFLNNPQINADLWYFNVEDDRKYLVNSRITYLELKQDYVNLVYALFETHDVAIINTDTFFIEKASQKKVNYNIEVFKDYTPEFIDKIIEYYNLSSLTFTKIEDNLSEKNREILTDYIFNNDLPSKYTKEELQDFSDNLPNTLIPKGMVYNSITTNYIKGVNKDLEAYIN